MKLQINMPIESDSIFEIEFGDKIKKVYAGKEIAIFNYDVPGKYVLMIRQVPTRRHLNFFLLLLLIPVSFIQFVFWGITADMHENWEVNLHPFCLTTHLRLKLCEDSTLNLHCFGGQYNDKTGLFDKPVIEIKGDVEADERQDVITLNRFDFRRRLFHYLRVITALFLTVLSFFFIVGVSGVKHANIAFIGISFAVILILLFLYIKILAKNIKKEKNLIKRFESQLCK